MSFGRDNFFDDENRRGMRSNLNHFDNDPFLNSTFGNFSNNAFNNMPNIRRQRSPIFNNRDQFEPQTSPNFPSSFPNRNANFGHQQQQPTQSQNESSSSKVYHVPIHIERDDDNQSSNSYIKINEQPNYKSNQQYQQQPNYNQQQQNYQQPDVHHHSNQPSSFYRKQDTNSHSNNLRRQDDSTRNQAGDVYRIPIRIEGDSNESNNLVRDFNNMHCPSTDIPINKLGQKNSTPANANEFINTQEFNNLPQQPQNYQQQNFNHNVDSQFDSQQQSNQQFNQPPEPTQQQQVPKKQDPMSIIQGILEEAEKYENEIDNFTGEYQDKKYRYLDEYLTRCMLKLDSIETNGDPNLKQARKNALIYINKVISKLEKLEHKKEAKDEQNVENLKEAEEMKEDEKTISQETNLDKSSQEPNHELKQEESTKEENELKEENETKVDKKSEDKKKIEKKRTNEKLDDKVEKKKIKK